MTNKFELANSTILVTGAAGGIGSGIATHLAKAGARIIVHYHRSLESAQTVAKDIQQMGGQATMVQADLSEEEQVEQLFTQLNNEHPLTGLVHAAARQDVMPLSEMHFSDWKKLHAANLDSTFLVTNAFCQSLIKQKESGTIVHIASIEGSDPAHGHSHYATSKAAMIMFTRAAALEMGKHNIRINSVSPGLINREGLTEAWPEGVSRWQDRAPLGRLGQNTDIAHAVQFLLSPAAAWITGIDLTVDGGMSAESRW